MLHILLLILKIIGIILAVILGILVLVLCIVLFVPVRYKVCARCDGTIDGVEADVKVTWLLHLIKVVFCFKNRKPEYSVRVAWKKIDGESGEGYEDEKEVPVEEMEEADSEIFEGDKELEEADEEKPGLPKRAEQKPEEAYEDYEEVHEEKSSFFERIKQFIKNIIEKISRFFKKASNALTNIKCTFERFCDKIKVLIEKKETLVQFIEDDVHQSAFGKVKKEVFCLLKRLRPRVIKADIRYGFSDPCLTGQVLAGLSVLYPFIGGHANIVPDFENQVLEGDVLIKGRIYAAHIVWLLWKLVWSRDVRRTYKDSRNFEF